MKLEAQLSCPLAPESQKLGIDLGATNDAHAIDADDIDA
jgi:hypothetical protein